MAATFSVIFALALTVAHAQFVPAAFFNVPPSPFNKGGRVNFAGSSLGTVCRTIMMMGGKDALSDGMGAAAKWFHSQKINSIAAGGTDPQMQCLYAQATGSIMPNAVGGRDPGNMFGDYFDSVIEYPITDPCSSPQCNGKVNPSFLLRQMYAPMMRQSMMGGAMGGAMGRAMGGAMGMTNPMLGQNPLMNALMPNRNPASTFMNPFQMLVPGGGANPMAGFGNPLQSTFTSTPSFMGGAMNPMMMTGMMRPGQNMNFPTSGNALTNMVSPATGAAATTASNGMLNKATPTASTNAMARTSSMPLPNALSQTPQTVAQNANLAKTVTQPSMATMAVPQITVPMQGSTMMTYNPGVMQPSMVTLNSPIGGGFTSAMTPAKPAATTATKPLPAATQPAAPTTPAVGGQNLNNLAAMFQNPQMMKMFQQVLMQQFMNQMGQNPAAAAAAGPASTNMAMANPLASFMGNNIMTPPGLTTGMPGMANLASFFS